MASFADSVKLDQHFFDHGPEFGSITKAQYLSLAVQFLTSVPPSLGTKECTRGRGDIVRFNPLTGEFGVVAVNGTIRTYFKPNPALHGLVDNEAYFRRECTKW